MERYENIIKIEEIRRLIDENLYAKAAKILDTMDISRIKALTDLSIIADVLTQNDRYEEAMEILQKIYNKSKTRRVLYQLVDISIRMEDIDNANQYLKLYIKLAPTDSHRYVFRYCIDKLSQKPYGVLLDSLEQLKEYEYIEMWAYELAKVYHKAGMKDKCVRECSDIILWFGEGVYVEKAQLLKAFYVGEINPAHIINAKNKKEAFKQLNLDKTKDYSAMRDEINEYLAKEEKEMSSKQAEAIVIENANYDYMEPQSYYRDNSIHNQEDGFILNDDDHQNKVNAIKIKEQEIENKKDVKYEAVQEIEQEVVQEIEQEIGQEVVQGIEQEIEQEVVQGIEQEVEYEVKQDKVEREINQSYEDAIVQDLDMNNDKEQEVQEVKQINQEEIKEQEQQVSQEEIKKIVYTQTNVDNELDETKVSLVADNQETVESYTDLFESVQEAAVTEEIVDTDAKAALETDAIIDLDINKETEPKLDVYGYFAKANFNTEEEFGAFLLVDGLKEQLQNNLENILSDSTHINYLVISGGKKTGRSTLAKKICKGLFTLNWIQSSKIAKITSDKLNQVDLLRQKEKLKNSTILIENVNHMTEETCKNLVHFIEEMRENIFVILEDEDQNLEELFLRCPFIKIYFSNIISIKGYTGRELFRFSEEYINQHSYQFLTEAKMEFFQRIEQILAKGDEPLAEALKLAKATVKAADNRYKGQLAEILNNRNLDTEDLLYIVKEDILEV